MKNCLEIQSPALAWLIHKSTSQAEVSSPGFWVAALRGFMGHGFTNFQLKKVIWEHDMFTHVPINTFHPGKICARDQVAYSQLVPAICLCPAVWSVLLRFILGEGQRMQGWFGVCPNWDFHKPPVIPRRPSLREFLRFLFTPRVILILVIIIAMGFCEGIMSLGVSFT